MVTWCRSGAELPRLSAGGYHRGHWKNPMMDAEIEDKFRSLARQQLPAAQADMLLRQLWALDTLPQAGAVIAARWV
jgi:2-methylcitrate dehydratase